MGLARRRGDPPFLTPDEDDAETQEPERVLGGPVREQFMDTLAGYVPAPRDV